MSTPPSSEADLTPYLPLLARGKVRELYQLTPSTLLFVASDRISAYDVILSTPIPLKGRILTQLSAHWFRVLSAAIPGLRHHLLTLDLPASIPASLHDSLAGRCMQVRALRILPIEAIVRGYITGSAWAEYRSSGTVNGVHVPPGLRESEAFPGGPVYTPSTKAAAGEHDENISVAEAARVIGDERIAQRVAELAVRLYSVARDYALERGIIIADTKFEFGVEEGTGEVVLVDEVLTPDSSRFWPAEGYVVGKGQASFDKQFLRDWLVAQGKKGVEGVEVPQQVVAETGRRYREAYRMLTGAELEAQ